MLATNYLAVASEDGDGENTTKVILEADTNEPDDDELEARARRIQCANFRNNLR
jgi:hypothetical protein